MSNSEEDRLKAEATVVAPAVDFLWELVDYSSQIPEFDTETNTAYKFAEVIFQRVLEQSAAARILIREGWLRQSETILRTALEYSMHISLLAKFPDLANGLLGLAAIQERRRLLKVKQFGFKTFEDDETIDEKLRRNGVSRREVSGSIEALRNQLNQIIEAKEQEMSLKKNEPISLPRVAEGELPTPLQISIATEIEGFDIWWYSLCESSHFDLLQLQKDHLRLGNDGSLYRISGRDISNGPSVVSDWTNVLFLALAGLSKLGNGYLDQDIERWNADWVKRVVPLLPENQSDNPI